MRKVNIIVLFIILIIILTGCGNNTLDIKETYNLISKSEIEKTIDKLTIAPRNMGSGQEKIIAQYLNDKLSDLGCETTIQTFDYKIKKTNGKELEENYFNLSFEGKKDGISQNVIAVKKSKSVNPKTIVISAHYDSKDNTLGANDNASGVAALIECARVLQKVELPFNIQFVLFTGEEKGLIGSRYYLANMDENLKKNIICNLNIDTIGGKSDSGYQIMTFGLEKTDGPINEDNISLYYKKNIISDYFTKNPKIKLISGMPSDHYSFYMANIPSATLVQSLGKDFKIPNIHTNQDSKENLDINRISEVVNFTIGWIDDLTNNTK